MIGFSPFTGQRETAESAACLIPCCGGVGFFTYPFTDSAKTTVSVELSTGVLKDIQFCCSQKIM